MTERLKRRHGKRYLSVTRIERRMRELEITRTDLCKAMEINLSTLWRHLGGGQPACFTFVAGLSKVLDLDMDQLTLGRQSRCAHCQSDEATDTAVEEKERSA